MNKSLYILDTTLRDGEQTVGVDFSEYQKITIAKKLDELGVNIIEVGIPAMGKDEIRAIRKIVDININAKLLTWNRMRIEDVKKSFETGCKNIHITVPASDLHMKKKLKMSREEVIYNMKKVVSYAVDKGYNVSVGAEDASRADFEFLISLYKEAKEIGVNRVRYADTVGALEPFGAYEDIKKIKDYLKIDIDFHGHNDFGLGTANALAAFKGGAEYISCSINGLGERAGNTPLEEIVMAIHTFEKVKTDIKVDKMISISKLVERFSGKIVHKGKPIVGEDVFSHESGIHIDGLIKDVRTYEFLSPHDLGRQRKFIHGKHSGSVFKKYLS